MPQGKKITNSVFREIQKHKIEHVEVASNDLEGAYVAADVIDMSTGEVLVEANHELTSTTIGKLAEAGIESSKFSSRSATKRATSFPPRCAKTP